MRTPIYSLEQILSALATAVMYGEDSLSDYQRDMLDYVSNETYTLDYEKGE